MKLTITFAFPSWCYTCEAVTGTKKEKQGKGQPPIYYCTKCGTAK